MKKMILMAAFAAISFAATAQNAPATASTSGTTDKKECANKSASCCAKGAGTASASVTPEVKSVSKSKAKKACCAGSASSAACGEAKAEKKAVN
jgi:hypothetical protein